jgi:hypothetical protein
MDYWLQSYYGEIKVSIKLRIFGKKNVALQPNVPHCNMQNNHPGGEQNDG